MLFLHIEIKHIIEITHMFFLHIEKKINYKNLHIEIKHIS
jgi:hypothetical protein